MDKLTRQLSDFVKEVCAERDESHGWQHMKYVAENSMNIYYSEYVKGNLEPSTQLQQLVLACAWLHDVPDHKYDHDGKLMEKVEHFLDHHLPENKRMILNVIDRVSFSKENICLKKGIPLDWDQVLGEVGITVRNIVSDADKLEALGKIGFERTCEYTREAYKQKHGKDMPYYKLVENVKQHSEDKLLRLKDEFIRTDSGKELAEPLHYQFKKMLDNMVVEYLDLDLD